MNILEICQKFIEKLVTLVFILISITKQVFTELRSSYDLCLYLVHFEISNEHPV